MSVFRFQAEHNAVYNQFINNLGLSIDKIHTIRDIPFLPISFFKTQKIKTGQWEAETSFLSSGTTQQTTSTHEVREMRFYLSNAERCFEHFFGSLKNFHFLALLPSYLERTHSSLVAMMDHFIKKSGSADSGFYLHDLEKLAHDLKRLRNSNKRVVLWGVTFALLDLIEKYPVNLEHCLVFETGGMKGRRREITREELHRMLKEGFQVDKIYSEYGMTELLSQAYTKGQHEFFCPPWLKVIGRDPADPFEKGLHNQTSGINIIDLANLHSIAFIETEDLGVVNENGSFEVLGRLDNSDVRGCNLMVE